MISKQIKKHNGCPPTIQSSMKCKKKGSGALLDPPSYLKLVDLLWGSYSSLHSHQAHIFIPPRDDTYKIIGRSDILTLS